MVSHMLDHKGQRKVPNLVAGDNAEPTNTSAVLQIRSVTCGTLPQAKQAGAERVRAVPHADQCPPIQIVSWRQRRSNIL